MDDADGDSADLVAAHMDGLCVADCTACPALADSRSRIVNGVGPDDAALLFVGEAPGRNEDEGGEPFVGRSGDVLDAALRDAGVTRTDVRITNCVRCRPPENRDPRAEELSNCRGYLDAEVERVDPDLVVALGKVPAEQLLDRDVAVTREAGETFDAALGGRTRRVLVSVHPAATLYDRSQEETFAAAMQTAADLSGVGDAEEGQSRLGDY